MMVMRTANNGEFDAVFAQAQAGDRIATTRLPAITQAMLDESTNPERRRTCAELGVCQGLSIPCLLCNDTWPEPVDTLTPMEQIGTWIGYTVLALLTVAVACGVAGYTYYRWIAP